MSSPGVATYCKENVTPFHAEEGITGVVCSAPRNDNVGHYGSIHEKYTKGQLKELDSEGRAIITQHLVKNREGKEVTLTVINVYCPRAESGNVRRLEVKMRFYDVLEMRTRALVTSGSYVVIVGDINAFHKGIDTCEPGLMDKCEKSEARKWLNGFIYDGQEERNGAIKMVDAFRTFHPDEENAFTCWCTELNARSNNYGSRIDYILTDKNIIEYVTSCLIHSEILGSDHCPVSATFGMTVLSSSKCPSACTRYFPEYQGVQQSLSNYVSKVTAEEKGSTTHKSSPAVYCRRATELEHPVPSKRQALVSYYFQKPSSTQTSSERNFQVNQQEKTSTSEVLKIGSAGHSSQQTASEKWKKILTGPRDPPLCSGHGEPCVLRVVKRKGQNINRRFWVCARGEGKSNDTNATCNHFQWN